MSEVERLAEVHAAAYKVHDLGNDRANRAACIRSVLREMREPSEAMCHDPFVRAYNDGPYGALEVRRIWIAMIDHLLAEGGGTE